MAIGVAANLGLHQCRLHLYDLNTDCPQFHPLQRVQYPVYYAALSWMAVGAAWLLWLRFRKRH